jgi:hypothetical protein
MMDGPLGLTAVPLQRAGAFALASLADRSHPHEVTDATLDAAAERMIVDAVNAATAKRTRGDHADPHAWWWGVLYGHFPNAREVHAGRHGSAEKDAEREGVTVAKALELRVREGRRLPAANPQLGVCAFCGRTACRLVDKTSWPILPRAQALNMRLAEADEPGTPLCRGCLASGWAVPYAARRLGRLFLCFDGDDEDLLRELIRGHVAANLERIAVAATSDPTAGWESPERIAYEALGHYQQPPRGDLRAVLYLNDAQEPVAHVRWLGTRRCLFAQRAQPHSPRHGEAVAVLREQLTHRKRDGSVMRPGMRRLAELLLTRPASQLVGVAAVAAGAQSGHAEVMREFTAAYLESVMDVTTEPKRIVAIAARIAEIIAADDAKGDLRNFQHASRNPGALQKWLRTAQVDWLLTGEHGEPLIDDDEYLVLFPPYGEGAEQWWRINLLFTAVIAELFRRGWLQQHDSDELAQLRESENDEEVFEE